MDQDSAIPKIKWVNHACFVLEADGVRLMADPWFEGTAFNNGWSLVADTRFPYEDFAEITHIWISHQHPDHLNPGTLKKIAPAHRKHITVFFHNTKDKRVLKYLRSFGFKEFHELPTSMWVALTPNFKLLCGRVGDDDSWLAMKTGKLTYLNLNDCVLSEKSDLKNIADIVGNVDVLLTQFSYASWAGNPDDIEARKLAARRKIDEMRKQIEALLPKWVVPFASYIYFSHADNFYMNDHVNQIDVVADFLATEMNRIPIVLYPGDEWFSEDLHDNSNAIARYKIDFSKKLQAGPTQEAETSDLERILHTYSNFCQNILAMNPVLRWLPMKSPVIHLIDHRKCYRLTFNTMEEVGNEVPIDISTNGDSFLYCLKFMWGFNTLQVNGRFLAPKGGEHADFFRFFRAYSLNCHGEAVSLTWLLKFAWRRSVKHLSLSARPSSATGSGRERR
jgi:hypothetical protein